MAKKVVKKKAADSVEKIKTITGATWHIGKEKKGLSTKLVAANGYVNRYDKGFNNKQNAMKNIFSSIRNGIIDDGIFIEALVAAKTREEVVDAISHYGYLKPKKVAALSVKEVKSPKRKVLLTGKSAPYAKVSEAPLKKTAPKKKK